MFGSTGSTFGGFGQNQQQQQGQQQGGGLFGGGTTGTTPAFGSSFGASSTPAFGAAAQPAQNTGFGGFGAGASTTPAFGSTASATPAFGQPAQQSGGGLFGSSQPAAGSTGFSFGGGASSPFPLSRGSNSYSFVAGGTSTFGASNTTNTGTTGGLFGAKPATTTFGGFGQPAAQPTQTGGGLFGGGAASTPAFGAAQQQQQGQGTGTAVAPYAPTTVMEPPAEEGKPPPTNQTAHQFQSIVCMPQYSKYSFEELRWQDYQANRKTPSAPPGFGSAFGASTTPAFGASSTGTTGGGLFGGASSTPTFGASNTSTGFGASNTGGGLFGAASNTGTSAFGQPATSQPAAGGGLFGSTPAAPATGGGLFGATSGTTSSPFGQPAASSTPAFGGFGASNAAKPATTGFSFGTPAASAAPATGGLFGSSQPAQPAANPFGQPAQSATGGGLFGQPAAAPKPSLFGSTTPATSAPAFGAGTAASTAPKPAFSFGSTPAAGTTGGGLFGSTAQPAAGAAAPATGGGLFGGGTSTFGQPAQPAAGTNTFGGGGLFGAKPAQPATGGGLFGSTQPATGGGLFGSTAAQPAQTGGGLFGSTAPSQPTLGGSLFGSTAAQQQQQPQQPTAYASADDANAYGSNPLFASAGAGVSPVRPVEEKKKPPIFTAFRGTPVSRSSTKITRLRGFGASTASPAPGTPLGLGSSLSASLASSAAAGAPGTPGGRGSPLRLVNGLSDDVALSPNAFVSRPSVKKLVIDKKSSSKIFAAPNPSPDKDAAAGQRAKVSFNPEVEVPSRSASLFGASRTPGPAADENSFVSDGGVTDGNVTLDSPSLAKTAATTEWPSRRPAASANGSPAKPKHGDYYTIPSLDTLQKLPAAKLRAVPDLVVGRVGYGQVAFSEPVDLTTLHSVEDLLGSLVQVEDRNASVYPEEYADVKPPAGEGLNVPAVITLEGCFPLDKATRKPIKDMDHPVMQKHVKRLRKIEGTQFVDFEPETGKWTFQVDEF
ncbi:hypothetical protein JCM10213v2_004116 [Rhodosporidiobolus nylandii]